MTLLFLLTCSLKRKNKRPFLTTREERTILNPLLSTSLVYYTNAVCVKWCQYFCDDVILNAKDLGTYPSLGKKILKIPCYVQRMFGCSWFTHKNVQGE